MKLFRIRRFCVIALLYILQISCTPPNRGDLSEKLERFSTSHGFTFYKDFSSANILGYVVDDENEVRRFDLFAITPSSPGYLTNVTETFAVEGNAGISRLLKAAPGKIKGDVSLVKRAEFSIEKPFYQDIKEYVPQFGLMEKKAVVRMVDKVLNSGNIRLRFFDKAGVNITSLLFEAGISSLKEYVETSEGMYIGYRSSEKEIALIDKAIMVPINRAKNECSLYVNTCIEYLEHFPTDNSAKIRVVPLAIPDVQLQALHAEGTKIQTLQGMSDLSTLDIRQLVALTQNIAGERTVHEGEIFGLRAQINDYLFVQIISIKPDILTFSAQLIRIRNNKRTNEK